MITHTNQVKIYHKDTDSYGIVWHGAYIKWFEVGRVELAALSGLDLKELEDNGILMPVVELNVRYKSPSRLFDELSITTEIKELSQTSITFCHNVENIKTGKLVLNAISTVVTTDRDGKLFRKIPDFIYNKFEFATKNIVLN